MESTDSLIVLMLGLAWAHYSGKNLNGSHNRLSTVAETFLPITAFSILSFQSEHFLDFLVHFVHFHSQTAVICIAICGSWKETSYILLFYIAKHTLYICSMNCFTDPNSTTRHNIKVLIVVLSTCQYK